jgi:hypothetical protein
MVDYFLAKPHFGTPDASSAKLPRHGFEGIDTGFGRKETGWFTVSAPG